MRELKCIWITLLMIASGSANAASFTPLGDLPGGSFTSFASGVSADGSRVVGFSTTAAGNEAYIWDAVNGMQGLGEAGWTEVYASGISADGSTVVGIGDQGSGGEAFIWDETNGLQGIGDLPGGIFSSSALGVSADGTWVVGQSVSDDGPEAFVWNAANGMQGLGDLAGGSFDSAATAVSTVGLDLTVVGYGRSASGPEGFTWDPLNGMVGLGDLPGGDFESYAWALSADGSTVAGSSASGFGTLSVNEAALGDATGWQQGLGDLPGGDFSSIAQAISADGSTVVGESDSASGRKAYVWDPSNGMRQLDLLLPALGVDLTGWSLTDARGVSADGRTIVGFGVNPDSQVEAWIAVIPEPGTALTLGLGLAALAGIGRRPLQKS